jgi:alpha-methylacyl-CoA racemase
MGDGASHFYDTYETADGKYIAVGAIEPAFYRAFRKGLGLLDDSAFDQQMDRARWPEMRAHIAKIILTKTRDEWVDHFDPDACVSPVLSLAEVEHHPHNIARGTFFNDGKALQPTTVPRFSRTPGAVACPPSDDKEDVAAVLAGWDAA